MKTHAWKITVSLRNPSNTVATFAARGKGGYTLWNNTVFKNKDDVRGMVSGGVQAADAFTEAEFEFTKAKAGQELLAQLDE